MNNINLEEFQKVEIRIGTVLEATKVPEADRLIQLIFDFGELEDVIPDMIGDPKIDSRLRGNDNGEVQDDKNREIAAPAEGEARNDEEGVRDGVNRLPELLEKYPGRDVRQIMSAIAPFYTDPAELVGKQIAVCVNLEPRKFKGYESQGMIMATDTEDGLISLLVPEKKVKPGSKIH